MSAALPPPLSEDELYAYLEYIGLSHWANLPSSVPRDLKLLTTYHVHQIAAVPYENLKLHYSDSNYSVSVDPHVVLKKILTRCGRGGYCMEISVLVKYVLEALGFNVYWSGVRIRQREAGVPYGDYIGLVHMINIVTLEDGSQYAVDMAFGGDGQTRPMLLKEGLIMENLGTQQVRYARARIVQSTSAAVSNSTNGISNETASQPHETEDNISPSEHPPGNLHDPLTFWVYQYRNSSTKPWNSYYCFQSTPFMYADFCIMSFAASTPGPCGSSPFQTTVILIVKFLASESKQGETPRIVGKRMMVNGTIKEYGPKMSTIILKDCKTEEERIQALKDYFGITLTDAEVHGIKGRMTELKAETV